MSSPRRAVLAGLGAVVALSLAACSGVTPLYQSPSLSGGTVSIAYASPSSRAEQIVYQDLALRIARGGEGSPRLTVKISQSSSDLTSNLVTRAKTQRQMVLTAAITLTSAAGEPLFSGTRSASADFTTDGQVLSSEAASADAVARAAHLLADQVRLIVLGELAK